MPAGSGHVDVGFDGVGEVEVVADKDGVRLALSNTGEHEARLSVVLDDDEARVVAGELLAAAEESVEEE